MEEDLKITKDTLFELLSMPQYSTCYLAIYSVLGIIEEQLTQF